MPGSVCPTAEAQLQGSLHAWSTLCRNTKCFVNHKSSHELEPLGGNPSFPRGKWTAIRRGKAMRSVAMCGAWKYSHR